MKFIKSINHQYAIIIASVVVALAIIVTAYVANGSEYEDAWLYIVAAWFVILPVWDLYSKRKSIKKKE